MSTIIKQLATIIPPTDSLDILRRHGFESACIYGGAIRDLDCSAYYNTNIPINDYDIRVSTTQQNYDQHIESFLDYYISLGAIVETMTGPDLLKPFHRVTTLGQKLDFSFRFDEMDCENAAINRVLDSDIGLSSIAYIQNPKPTLIYSSNYLVDRNNKCVTIVKKPQELYMQTYANRISFKYREHVDGY